MFKIIFFTELKSNLKTPAFWITLLVITFISFQDSSNVVQGRRVLNDFGLAYHNAPLFIARVFALLCIVTLLLNIVITGRVITRDFERKTHPFYFTLPITKGIFLFGRFLGGFTTLILAFIGVVIGFVIASCVSSPNVFAAHNINAYLFGWFFIALPFVLFASSLFFFMATLTRNMVLTYLSGVSFLLLFGIGSSIIETFESETFKVLIDPTGLNYLNQVTTNWTVADINSNQMPIAGLFIINRLILIALSCLLLYVTYKKFKFQEYLESKTKKKSIIIETLPYIDSEIKLPTLLFFNSRQAHARAVLHSSGREAWRTIKHPAFLILVFISVETIYSNFTNNVGPNGSNVYPLTSWYLRFLTTSFGFVIPLTIFFGGTFVFKDRDNGTAPFYDVLPLPTQSQYLSKLFMLLFVYLFYITIILLCGLFCQIVLFGYTDVEINLYLKTLFGIELINYLHVAVAVLFINTLVKNKYEGFFLSAVFYAADIIIFQMLEVNNSLIHYGSLPEFVYSNLSGFGAYTTSLIWHRIYWIFPTLLLTLISILLWQTGEVLSFKEKIKVAISRCTIKYRIAILLCTLLTAAIGGYIYYNENAEGHNLREEEQNELSAGYEKSYTEFKNAPAPTLEKIFLVVDMFPENGSVNIKGYYTLVNETNKPIKKILLRFANPFKMHVRAFTLQNSSIDINAYKDGTCICELRNFIQPKDSANLFFDYTLKANPFNTNNALNLLTVHGNLINNYTGTDFFPEIGYNIFSEIPDSATRAQYGLVNRPMLYPAGDSVHAARSFRSFVNYEAIISAPSDLTVVSNGTLLKKWSNNKRVFFHYKTAAPINNAIAITSGNYKLKSVKSGNHTLEVYYDARHPYNIDRMINGMGKSLAYCVKNYSPYPYETIRIVEVNRVSYPGSGTASSIPTIFTWQEYGGFISNLENSNDMDVVFNTTTHEFAHQWWGNMILPASVEGTGVMTETMAQWVRIMCLEHEFGVGKVKQYLKDELEHYLRARKRSLRGEVPLTRSQNQSHLLYNKGTLVMYTLKEYIGEDSLNKALKKIVDKYAMQKAKYATVLDLIKEIKAITPEDKQYLVSDLFEHITIYDLSINKTDMKSENNTCNLMINITAKKSYADRLGEELETPMDDFIPIVVEDRKGEVIYKEMIKLKSGVNNYMINVTGIPAKVILDPMGALIERNKDDNSIAL